MTQRPRRKIFATRLLVAAALVALIWVGARFARRAGEAYFHSWLEDEASARVGATVSIGELELGLLPLGARASDVVITSLDDSAVLASAETVELDTRWRDLDATPRRLRSLSIVNLRVRGERRRDGTFSWPKFDPGDGGGRGVAIDRIEVRGGAIAFSDRLVPLDLDLRQVRAQASGSTRSRFSGRIDAAEAIVGLPTGAIYVGALSARGTWKSGRLQIASGRVSGPDLRVAIRAGELDLTDKSWRAQLEASGQAALFRRLGLGDRDLSGQWQFAGELSGGRAWRLAGRLSGRNVGWDDLTLARLDGDLVASSSEMTLSGIEGRFADGDVRARVDVAWSDPGRPVRVDAELRGASLPALLDSFKLDFPQLAGSWNGSGSYVFEAADPLGGNGSADIEFTAHDRAERLQWRRQVPMDIDHGIATFRTLTTDTSRERVSAHGSYDLRANQADVEYRVDTEQLGAWIDLAGLGADPESARWLPSAGRGSFAGALHVMPGDWWSRMTLDLAEVSLGEFGSAAVKGPLSVSSEGVRDMRLEMTRFGAAMLVAGAIDTRPSEPARLSLGLEVSGWPVEEFFAQMGLTPTLSGPLEASARIDGVIDSLRIAGRTTVAPARIAGLSVDAVEAEITLENENVRFDSATVEMPGGRLSLDGAVPLDQGALDLAFSIALSDLAASPLGSRLPAGTTGGLSGRGALGGTLESPTLEAELESPNLHLGGRPIGGQPPGDSGVARLSVSLAGGRLELDGAVGELVTIAGGGELTPEAADLELRLASDRLGTLMALLLPNLPPGLGGSFRGSLRLAGDLEDGIPEPEIRLDELTLIYAGHELTALEPVEAVWREDGLDVESFFLGDEATDSEVFLFGRLAMGDSGALDLRGQISIETVWFEPLLPGWEVASGRFDALASVGGTFERPEINGQGELRQSRLRPATLPQALSDMEAIVLFYPGQMVIDDGRAEFAGGTLRAAGTLDPFAAGELQYRFQVAADDLQLRYPEGWQVRGDAELVVASEPGGQLVRGQVTVDDALFTDDVAVGLTQLLQSAFSRRIELVEEGDEFLAATRLNVSVRGDDALSVRNNVASLRGDFDFVVRGNLARPVIFGTADVEPGGTLLYADNSYEVQRASLRFANPYRIEPVIDLVATTRLAQYDVTLDLSGTLDRLDVNFASNPPLADLQVLALLAGGEAPQSTDLGRAGRDSGDIAESFLYNQAASVVAARFNRLFGLDKFRIDPLTGDSGNLSSARVTVGKRLSSDLFATYSYDPSQSGQQILELEWRVSRELTVVATQNGDDSYALDLRWDKSF